VCEQQFSKDRNSAISFYKELATVVHANGKRVISYWHVLHLAEMKYLGNFD
jgi:hypothetical protein